MLKRLHHLKSHFVLTDYDPKTAYCHLGFSDYVLKYFLRFNKIDKSDYPKTSYGMAYTTPISLFVRETFKKYEQEKSLREKLKMQGGQPQDLVIPNPLSYSEKMEYNRFFIKRGEPFAMLKTCEYDIELTAPFDMRVIDLNHQVYYFDKFHTAPYIFQVQCFNTAQLNDFITEEQYVKTPKFFQYG